PAPGEPDGKKLEIAGRILKADRQAAAQARVAVIGWPRAEARGRPYKESWPLVLAQGLAGPNGRFRLTVPRHEEGELVRLMVLARAEGHGIGGGTLESQRADVEGGLPRGRGVAGRVVGLQGQPAAGTHVHIAEVWFVPGNDGNLQGVAFREPPHGLSVWPEAATTDAQGRFTLRGLLPKGSVTLHAGGGTLA